MNNRLKVLRAERNLTQNELANMTGLSRFTINGLETQRITPNADTMLRLTRALNVPVDDIFLDFKLCKNNEIKKEDVN